MVTIDAPKAGSTRRLSRRTLTWSGALVVAAAVATTLGLTLPQAGDGRSGSATTTSDRAAGGGASAGGAVASAARPAAPPDLASPAPSTVPGSSVTPGSLVTTASLVITGSLSVTVPATGSVDAAAARARAVATAEGGRVDSDDRASTPRRTATLVLRVPNARLADAITQLAKLGTVTSRSLRTTDVTSRVADVNSRVTSARAAIAGLDRLFARATGVRDVISLETTLAARESDLESLEAQQAALSAQTTLSSLTVDLVSPHPAAAPHHGHRAGGLVAGLHAGWHAFTRTVVGVGLAIGAVLPFAVAVALLAGVAVLVRRRLRHRAAPAVDGES